MIAFWNVKVRRKSRLTDRIIGIQSSGEFYHHHREQLPDDFVGVRYDSRLTDNTIQLESKKDIKKRGRSYADPANALARTYACPISQIRNVILAEVRATARLTS